jgi:3-oxoacyl-[acyl-carrier-protein] synthase II
MDRFTQFAVAAAAEAMQEAGLTIDEQNRDRVGILIGTGIGGIGTLLENYATMLERGPDRVSPFLVPMMISDSAAGILAIRTGARGRLLDLAVASAIDVSGALGAIAGCWLGAGRAPDRMS